MAQRKGVVCDTCLSPSLFFKGTQRSSQHQRRIKKRAERRHFVHTHTHIADPCKSLSFSVVVAVGTSKSEPRTRINKGGGGGDCCIYDHARNKEREGWGVCVMRCLNFHSEKETNFPLCSREFQAEREMPHSQCTEREWNMKFQAQFRARRSNNNVYY